jgi:hypothetical protein
VTFGPVVQLSTARTMSMTAKEGGMQASVGDRIVIKGHHVGEPDRDCEVIEVRGAAGDPPYLVRWGEDGHESLFFPASDAVVQHFVHTN